MHHAFWDIWAGAEDGSCSSEPLDEKPTVVKFRRRYAQRRQLKVVADLCLSPHHDETQAYFLKWAQQRKDSLHLCCINMKIWAMPVDFVLEILNVFHPEHIEEFELNTEWNVFNLARLAPCFWQMRNLRKVFLAPLHKNTSPIMNITGASKVKCIKKIISQFSKFNCLQHVFMKRVHFLRDHLHQILG